VVAYGAAAIGIRTKQQGPARITSHYFGGAVTQGSATPADGWLHLSPQTTHDGKPLEHLEITWERG
jgi:hypothetical protein